MHARAHAPILGVRRPLPAWKTVTDLPPPPPTPPRRRLSAPATNRERVAPRGWRGKIDRSTASHRSRSQSFESVSKTGFDETGCASQGDFEKRKNWDWDQEFRIVEKGRIVKVEKNTFFLFFFLEFFGKRDFKTGIRKKDRRRTNSLGGSISIYIYCLGSSGT